MLAANEWKRRIFFDLLHVIFTNFLDLKLVRARPAVKPRVSAEKRMLY